MKIGIMGGTFDPIHIGHLILAEQAKEQYSLDKIWVMPNGNPRYKSDRIITDSTHRAEMVRRSIANNPDMELSLLEINRKGYTYTYETLEELKAAQPENEYYFIIGADSLFALDTWKHPEIIGQDCILLAANRNQAPEEKIRQKICFLQEQYQMRICLLSCPTIGISSEMIRRKAAQGSSIRYYVTDQVYAYIEKYSLYQEGH
ncbi:MAG: nicotinate-nucleotide adenylyltransferase [Lachnospiraceae bacterium]|nr:nicotinate-nucleotide adenylyltransferase [Lachnospiraceae bacterium]